MKEICETWEFNGVRYSKDDVVEFSQHASRGKQTDMDRIQARVQCVHEHSICVDTSEFNDGYKLRGAGCHHTWKINKSGHYGIKLLRKNVHAPLLDAIRKATAV